METSPSRQSKTRRGNSPPRPGYQQQVKYELIESNETVRRQKDVRNVRFKKGSPKEGFPSNDLKFQVPENDNKLYLQGSSLIAKPRKHQRDNPIVVEESRLHAHNPPGPQMEHVVERTTHIQEVSTGEAPQTKDLPDCFPHSSSIKYYPKTVSNAHPTHVAHKYNSNQSSSYVRPVVQTRTYDYSETNRLANTDSPMEVTNLDRESSLICRAINYDGQPVRVNDEIVRDKLILSCRPKKYYQIKSYGTRPMTTSDGRTANYIYNTSNLNVIDNVGVPIKATDLEYEHKVYEQPPSTVTEKHLTTKAEIYDHESVHVSEHISDDQRKSEKYGEQYRAIQCKRYTRNFKVFLWALFFINILLLLVGLALLLITLDHLLFHEYINIVLAHKGYVTWVWFAMILSLMIIFVAAYGIITSISRSRKMLTTYCIMAAILAILILIFLLLFWILISNLKTTLDTTMKYTFDRYRCNRWIHYGWDTMQERHECCGVEARGDWRYIPPSCCHAETSVQRVACISHFIPEELAFKGGCRAVMDDYFVTMFLLITCLLVLAFILLLLGILAALRLLKMYKVILLCRDMYLITSH